METSALFYVKSSYLLLKSYQELRFKLIFLVYRNCNLDNQYNTHIKY